MSPSPVGGARRPTRQRRSGMAAVVAMLYMVLFASLALGFYAQTTISSQVGYNEQRMLHSRTAAESGMEWIRYQLLQVQIPPFTLDEQILELVYKDFTNRLEMTGNLGTGLVYMNPGGTQIEVPEGSKNYISVVDKGPRFRIVIKQTGRDLVVTSIGSPGEAGGSRSGVELTFRPIQERGSFFSHGMASMGGVNIASNDGLIQGIPAEYANVYALGPVTIGPGKLGAPAGFTGELYVPEGTVPTLLVPVSIDGVTDPVRLLNENNDHINYVSDEEMPEYPVADVSKFKELAKNKYVAGLSTYDNIWIPRGTNPTFAAGKTLRGVVFVEQPNYVKFDGGVILHCIIATDPTPPPPPTIGSLATNVLEFTGTGAAKEPVSTLPLLPQFEEVRKLTGSFIVAPKFDLKITGNFQTAIGDICADRISIGGSADVNIAGAIYTLAPYPLTINGSANVSVKYNPDSLHSGIRHTEAFYALPSTWKEIILP